jgi:anti-sigma factor NepR-like protein
MASKNGSAWSAAGRSDSTSSASEKGLQQSSPAPGEKKPISSEENEPAGASDAERKVTMKPQTPPEQATREGSLERSLQAQLGRQLRTIFADVAEEPVPDRFRKLLDELEAREKRR